VSKLRAKLERLYQLAILRAEEEDDEARQNEARTSAFLLIKIARENGVKIVFKVPTEKVPEQPTDRVVYKGEKTTYGPGSNTYSYDASGWFNHFEDFLRRNAVGDVLQDMFRDMHEQSKAQAKSAPGFKYPNKWSKSKSSPVGAPPSIVAGYSGSCRVCHRQYGVGDRVWWVQSWGCAHDACGYEQLVIQSASG
jgi:hypothetical protein